jgi:hypothetical protein
LSFLFVVAVVPVLLLLLLLLLELLLPAAMRHSPPILFPARGRYANKDGYDALEACCECGGGSATGYVSGFEAEVGNTASSTAVLYACIFGALIFLALVCAAVGVAVRQVSVTRRRAQVCSRSALCCSSRRLCSQVGVVVGGGGSGGGAAAAVAGGVFAPDIG